MRLFCILLLAPAMALADGETLHLRPSSACGNDGDGTAYACAASGGAAGAWTSLTGFNDTTKLAATDTAGKVDPGDTLCIHGTIDGQLTYGQGIGSGTLGSGSEGSPVTIDFDCADESGSLDPADKTTNYAFYSEQTWLVINEPTGSGPVTLGNVFAFPVDTQTKNITINGGFVQDCEVDTGESCLYLQGDNITVDGFMCGTNVERYCVLTDGDSITVRNSIATANSGTCFVMDRDTNGGLYEYNSCTQVINAASRSCYEANDQDGPASTAPIFRFNTCVIDQGNDFDTYAVRGYLIKGPAEVYGGHIEGPSHGVSIESGGQVGPIRVAGVIFSGVYTRGINLTGSFTDVLIYNNTFTGDSGRNGDGIDSFVTSSGMVFRNNIIQGFINGVDESNGSSNVEEYNVFYDNTTDRRLNFSPVSIDGTSISGDPSLDSEFHIAPGSNAWDAGVSVDPWYGSSGECYGNVTNIGASCAVQVSPQHRSRN